MGDDGGGESGDGDGARLGIIFGEIDVIAPEGGTGKGLEFKEDGTDFEVSVLGLEAALEDGNIEIEAWKSHGGTCLDFT